ncbi:MAG: BspA family leucine-rich repeat surface protein, partial [Cenarchaeum sp. SB0675_bin_21]|nr:BspA family leucine-rich repeat surface protein [Cenarchaeum sp. SB0675_bin_21]
WDVSGVTGMANMFSYTHSFDSDLSGWDVSGVTTMYAMFAGARSFDSDLSGWDVSGVADMADMFRSTGAFNSDISRWEIQRDTRITAMLYRADAFEQNLGEWYIIMQDTSIRPGDVPGIVGYVTTLNPYLDGQNPSYKIGTGGDSGHFEMESNALRLKSVPEGSGPYTVNITSSGGYGTGNSRTLGITVSDSAGPAPTGPRDITGLTLASTAPGTAEVSWDAPARTPDGYRVSWAKVGESYLAWRNSDGNAFPTSPGYTIMGLEEGEAYKVQVRARYSDGGPGPWSGEVTITVSANTPPTVSAGPDQTVAEGDTVVLAGTASDADADAGDTLTYLWSQNPSSPTIAFANATSISTTFAAPQVSSNATITLTLTATDQHNTAASDTMTLTITDVPDTTPLANNHATGSPAITGTIQVSQTLTADTSDISDADGMINATFAYQWLSNDGATTSEISGAASSSYTLAASDQGKTIQVRVTFTDDAGNPESLTSVATSQVAPTVPGSPSISSVLPAARGELSISWQAPIYNGGSNITGYIIQWKEATGSWSNSADVSEATTTDSHYTVTGLTDGTTYAVRVIATNQAGDGQPSSEATATPRNPRHITGFTLSSTQPGTIQVDWSEPAEDPTNYRVSWAKVDERFPTLAASTGYAFPDSTSYTITGLEEGAEYKVKVRARYDSGGNGAWSDILTATVASSR